MKTWVLGPCHRSSPGLDAFEQIDSKMPEAILVIIHIPLSSGVAEGLRAAYTRNLLTSIRLSTRSVAFIPDAALLSHIEKSQSRRSRSAS